MGVAMSRRMFFVMETKGLDIYFKRKGKNQYLKEIAELWK